VIEKAVITVKTPYPLDELDNLLGLGDVFYAQPSGFVVHSDRIIWTFENLEPTEEDNIVFRALPPRAWYPIRDSLITLETNPDDWQAHESLVDGLSTWIFGQVWAENEGLANPFTEMETIGEMIVNSTLKVLELSPTDKSRYSSALYHLGLFPDLIGGDQLEDLYLEAIELFPDQEYFREEYDREKEKGLFEIEKLRQTPAPTPSADTATAEIIGEDRSSVEQTGTSFPLIMGLLFISGGIVLLIIAIRRRAK
jgi:hypothetical protein